MDSDRILTLLLLIVAVAAGVLGMPVVPEDGGLALAGLALLVLGLVSGYLNPAEDIMERTAYLVAAVLAPAAANRLDLIPVVGEYLNAIIDGVAVGAAGMWISSFTRGLVSRISSSS